jgi:hypothetical protein
MRGAPGFWTRGAAASRRRGPRNTLDVLARTTAPACVATPTAAGRRRSDASTGMNEIDIDNRYRNP